MIWKYDALWIDLLTQKHVYFQKIKNNKIKIAFAFKKKKASSRSKNKIASHGHFLLINISLWSHDFSFYFWIKAEIGNFCLIRCIIRWSHSIQIHLPFYFSSLGIVRANNYSFNILSRLFHNHKHNHIYKWSSTHYPHYQWYG